jgi:hypothetical protein
LEFIREVLKRDPADVAALLELWAVSREQGVLSFEARVQRLRHVMQEIQAQTPW